MKTLFILFVCYATSLTCAETSIADRTALEDEILSAGGYTEKTIRKYPFFEISQYAI